MTDAQFPASLHWLPPVGDFAAGVARSRGNAGEDASARFASLRGLANRRLDFLQTRRIDRMLAEIDGAAPQDTPRLRLALLGSGTLDHLAPAIRVASLRRGLLVEVEIGPYGQWRQQILDSESALYRFKPDAVLLAPDMPAMLPELPLDMPERDVARALDGAVEELVQLWRLVRDRTNAAVIQETPWLDEPSLYGHFERQVPASPGAVASRLDNAIVAAAAAEGVLLLDMRKAIHGLGAQQIADSTLIHHAKLAVSPAAAPWAGDQIGRILAAIRGLSKKAIVLDLDNTLWGGVIGDDGLEGIVIGQGSAAGEAFAAFQRYLKRLAGRGVVLAVSSKNDRDIARSAFTEHPEMVLRLCDFAAFKADWNDKPSAVRRIAQELELGLDSFVFVDDNPAERALMRRVLPQVSVPELPEAPELYARCLAEAGYFEAVSFTAEDTKRNAQYVANRARRELQSTTQDLEAFLRDLQMTLTVVPFRPTDIARVTQLINKTNQFNLTTRRYTEAEVRAFMQDPTVLTFAGRLTDRFGDNGLTSIVICRPIGGNAGADFEIDTWLMSCRILGRRVEDAMLTVVAGKASAAGAQTLLGCYRPTAKNGLVKDFYPKLGFSLRETDSETGESTWIFPLDADRFPATDHLRLVCE
jgi:FkbH-like protein